MSRLSFCYFFSGVIFFHRCETLSTYTSLFSIFFVGCYVKFNFIQCFLFQLLASKKRKRENKRKIIFLPLQFTQQSLLLFFAIILTELCVFVCGKCLHPISFIMKLMTCSQFVLFFFFFSSFHRQLIGV